LFDNFSDPFAPPSSEMSINAFILHIFRRTEWVSAPKPDYDDEDDCIEIALLHLQIHLSILQISLCAITVWEYYRRFKADMGMATLPVI